MAESMTPKGNDTTTAFFEDTCVYYEDTCILAS